ncbi:Hypp1116 [Branchiostoma lanceolatum]|uniref:Hypp1116 protein n=1 Tax=Branchiostoma lanceolatum TaxID=7740 RepID=A0A8J9ZH69_BRALA|nr:Hypp1116 [Branchiostoma lanceolatum]
MASGAGKRKTRKPVRFLDDDRESATAKIDRLADEIQCLETSLRKDLDSLHGATSNDSVASGMSGASDRETDEESDDHHRSRPSLTELRQLAKLQEQASRAHSRNGSLLGGSADRRTSDPRKVRQKLKLQYLKKPTDEDQDKPSQAQKPPPKARSDKAPCFSFQTGAVPTQFQP